MKSKIFTLIFTLSGSLSLLRAQVWQQQNPHFATPTSIIGLSAPNATDVWAFGFEYDSTGTWTEENFTVSRTADGGQSWENLTFPHTEPGYFSNVCARSSELAWIAYVDYTNGSKLYKTTDGGQNWTEQPVPISVWINFVHFFDNAVGVAMGDPDDQGFEIYTTVNGGDLWTRVSAADVPPPLTGEYGYSNYFEVSGNKVWFETPTRVYFSADKGNTWEVFDGPLPNIYSMFAADDNGMCYMSYGSSNPDGTSPVVSLYRTPDNGQTWEDVTPADNAWWVYDIEPVPGTDAIIGTFHQGFISGNFETRVSHDQGISWLTIDDSSFVRSLDFVDPEHGFGAGWQFVEDTTDADMYYYVGSPLSGLFSRKSLNSSLLASPNPTNGLVNVQFQLPVTSSSLLLLNDANGRLLHKQVFGKTGRIDTALDLSGLPAGVYTLTVSTADGVATSQLVRQ